jgi:hypothetical protein
MTKLFILLAIVLGSPAIFAQAPGPKVAKKATATIQVAKPISKPATNNPVKNKYDYIGNFHKGLAVAEQNNKWGLIDESGNIKLPFTYDRIDDFAYDGFYIRKLGEKCGIIDDSGIEIGDVEFDFSLTYRYANSSDGVINRNLKNKFIVGKNDKYGVIDHNGNQILEFKFNHIQFDCGVFTVSFDQYRGADGYDKKYTFYDQNGAKLIQKEYAYAGKFFKGYTYIGVYNGQRARYGIIDNQGQEIIPPVYRGLSYDVWFENTRTFSEGLIFACNEQGLCGFLDTNGEIAIPFVYDDPPNYLRHFYFSEGLAGVIKNNKVGFINRSGETVIPFIYDIHKGNTDPYHSQFKDGKAWVRLNGNSFYINKQGKCMNDCP